MTAIDSLSHYIDIITKIGAINRSNDGGFNTLFRQFYRGHSNNTYKLLPSIARVDTKKGRSNLNFEFYMINRAKLRNPNELAGINNQINLLARLQHYGLQTRLLDITENALVALYFACEGSPDAEGEVLVFESASEFVVEPDMFHANAYAHFSKLIANEYTLEKFVNTLLKDNPNGLAEKVNFTNKDDVVKHLIDSRFLESNSLPLILNHEIQSEREIRQQAAFLLFPNEYDPNSKKFKNNIVELDKNNNMIVERIIVPKSLKNELLDQLRKLGITFEFLFPEFYNRCKAINEDVSEVYSDNADFRITLEQALEDFKK